MFPTYACRETEVVPPGKRNCSLFYMAARAIWKGVLKVGKARIPIKLYSAVQERDVRFHVVQSRTKARIKQHMVSSEGRQEVQGEKIRKGYEVEPGTFVVLENEELQKLKPKESREIATTRFVPASQLSHEWYERPYYLAPDGDEAKYFALAEALRKRDARGIARWTMRGKSYVGALMAEGDYLVLIKLRYAEEVLSTRELPAPEGRPLAANELRMAEELVSALAGKFAPEEFRDEYRDRVLDLIKAKAKGKHPRLPAVKDRRPAASLSDQLAKSLSAMKRTRREKVA
jgi:DNA end-binding protein Ku